MGSTDQNSRIIYEYVRELTGFGGPSPVLWNVIKPSGKSFKRCANDSSVSHRTSRAGSENNLLVRDRLARVGLSQKRKNVRSTSSIVKISGIDSEMNR